jgi:hypothetical protein
LGGEGHLVDSRQDEQLENRGVSLAIDREYLNYFAAISGNLDQDCGITQGIVLVHQNTLLFPTVACGWFVQ